MEPGFQVLQISHTHNKDQQLYAVFHRIPPAKNATVPPDTPGTLSASAIKKPQTAVFIEPVTLFIFITIHLLR